MEEIYEFDGKTFRHTVILRNNELYTVKEELEPGELFRFLRRDVALKLLQTGKVVFL